MGKEDRMRNAPLNRAQKKVTFEEKGRAGVSERADENSKYRGPGTGSCIVWSELGMYECVLGYSMRSGTEQSVLTALGQSHLYPVCCSSPGELLSRRWRGSDCITGFLSLERRRRLEQEGLLGASEGASGTAVRRGH